MKLFTSNLGFNVTLKLYFQQVLQKQSAIPHGGELLRTHFSLGCGNYKFG